MTATSLSVTTSRPGRVAVPATDPAGAEAPVVAAVRDVRRSFGDTVALDGVTVEVRRGEAVGLLGPNGAGKSTLISLLTGLRRPDAGEVTLFGGSPLDPARRAGLGVTPQATAVPSTLKVREVLEFVAAHHADPIDLDELLADVDLTAAAGKQCGALSGGQQRRLLVALALIGRPTLVVLDEPTTGLDTTARDRLWERLRRHTADGGTLLITSHYLAEIEALASRVVVIDHGRVIADGTVDEVRSRVDISHVRLRTPAGADDLAALPGVVAVTAIEPDHWQLATRDADVTVRALCSGATTLEFADLEVARASLEDAFLSLTQ